MVLLFASVKRFSVSRMWEFWFALIKLYFSATRDRAVSPQICRRQGRGKNQGYEDHGNRKTWPSHQSPIWWVNNPPTIITHSLTHSLTQSITHSLNSLAQYITHSLNSLVQSTTHSLIHSIILSQDCPRASVGLCYTEEEQEAWAGEEAGAGKGRRGLPLYLLNPLKLRDNFTAHR